MDRKMSKIEELRKIKKDEDKWRWLINNKGAGLIVNLDNDDTFVIDPNDDEVDVVSFDSYLGWSDGVQKLLSAIGVKSECV